MSRIKYPRTMNLPWSESNSSDDVWLSSCAIFEGREVVVTEKLDGECVHEQTLVQTKDGAVPIAELTLPSNVLAHNTITGRDEFVEVQGAQIIKQANKDWFEIETEHGAIVRLTGDHYVWLPKLECYRRVKDLLPGDEILLRN